MGRDEKEANYYLWQEGNLDSIVRRLQGIGIPRDQARKYSKKLKAHQVDSVEDISLLDRDDLVELGVSMGKRGRMLKMFQEWGVEHEKMEKILKAEDSNEPWHDMWYNPWRVMMNLHRLQTNYAHNKFDGPEDTYERGKLVLETLSVVAVFLVAFSFELFGVEFPEGASKGITTAFTILVPFSFFFACAAAYSSVSSLLEFTCLTVNQSQGVAERRGRSLINPSFNTIIASILCGIIAASLYVYTTLEYEVWLTLMVVSGACFLYALVSILLVKHESTRLTRQIADVSDPLDQERAEMISAMLKPETRLMDARSVVQKAKDKKAFEAWLDGISSDEDSSNEKERNVRSNAGRRQEKIIEMDERTGVNANKRN